MNNYDNHNDLINKIKNENCSRSLKMLMDDFDPLFKHINYSILSHYKHMPLDQSDLKNVMQFNFHKLVMEFDATKGMEFASYIKKYLNYSMRNYVREFIKPNQVVMNFREQFQEELISSTSSSSFTDEEYEEIIKNAHLTPREEKVIRFLNENDKVLIADIAKIIGRSYKMAYKVKQSAIDKIKKSLETNI